MAGGATAKKHRSENGGAAGGGKHVGTTSSRTLGSLSLITFAVLTIAWLTGFLSRLFSVIRFESIIHEFDPW